MKTSAFRLALLLGLTIAAGTNVATTAPSPDPDLKQLAGYRQWQRLTQKPIAVNAGSVGG